MSISDIVRSATTIGTSPAAASPAIDLEQLNRIGQDDRNVIREILATFDLEIEMLVARMGSEEPKTAASRAHVLGVAARAVGAWRLAEAASAFENAAAASGALTAALHQVSRAATEVQMEIDDLLSPRMFGHPPANARARRVW